jgi:tetratricopeptide (TPR) repeat protein
VGVPPGSQVCARAVQLRKRTALYASLIRIFFSPTRITVNTIARLLATSAFIFFGTVANAADIQPAIAEFNALHHAKAKPMFLALLKEAQHKNLANYYLGRIELGYGKYPEATDYLEASVGIEPNSADELYWLATACSIRLQRPSESGSMGLFICYSQNLETAFGIDPTHLPTLMSLHQFNATGPAVAGASEERAEQLLGDIEKISKAEADIARLVVLNNKKESAKALTLSQTMLVAYPNSERALLEAGRVLSNNKRYAEAFAAFDKVTAKKPTIDNRQWLQAAYLEIGHISWRTKADLDRGIAALTKSVDTEAFPTNINTNWAYLRLAQLSHLKGDAAGHKKYLVLLDKTGIEQGSFLLKEIEALTGNR